MYDLNFNRNQWEIPDLQGRSVHLAVRGNVEINTITGIIAMIRKIAHVPVKNHLKPDFGRLLEVSLWV